MPKAVAGCRGSHGSSNSVTAGHGAEIFGSSSPHTERPSDLSGHMLVTRCLCILWVHATVHAGEAAGEAEPRLRGSGGSGGSRGLQGSASGTAAREQESVVPICRPGYQDVTNGQAFELACASHCPGGPYATATCSCACPSTPVIEIPLGTTGATGEAGQASLKPAGVRDFIAKIEEQTTTSQPEEEEKEAGIEDLVILVSAIVLLSSSAVVVAVGVLSGFCKKREKREKKRAWAAPAHSMRLPKEKCPEPPAASAQPIQHLQNLQPIQTPGPVGGEPSREDLDVLELSSVTTQQCSAKSPSEPQGPDLTQPRGILRMSFSTAKVSRVRPVS